MTQKDLVWRHKSHPNEEYIGATCEDSLIIKQPQNDCEHC